MPRTWVWDASIFQDDRDCAGIVAATSARARGRKRTCGRRRLWRSQTAISDADMGRARRKRELVDGLDLMVVRELTGGVYFGEPKQIIDLGNGQKRAIDMQDYHTYEIERIGRVAFELAGQRRNKVPSSDERNVMKSGVLWDEVITALRAREYPDVEPFAISNYTEGSQPDTTKQIRGSKA
jgi:hypothetical protein